MTTFSPASQYIPETPTSQRHWLRYLILGITANAFLWAGALFYLKTKEPIYTSEWAITLPGVGSSVNVNLPNLGATSSQIDSPYDGNTQDPRENYKFIASSGPVRRAAAESLDMSLEEFGQPRVQIVDNTTLIEFAVSGDTPEQAHRKALALNEAVTTRVNELRVQETAERNAIAQTALEEAQQNLELAQQRLSAYKAQSGLTSNTQLEQLSSNIEQLRSQRALLIAEQRQASARLQQLSSNLDVSANQAAEAFKLNADQLFQQNLRDYGEATATLDTLSARFGPNHPAIVREVMRQEAAQTAMMERSQALLGRPVNMATLAQLNVGYGNEVGRARETLFQETVTAQVDQEGLAARVIELDRQIAQLETRLTTYAQYGATLEALNRDMTIAETVFSSNLTRLNLGQPDPFGAYPQTQLLTEPNIPEDASAPNEKLVFLGTALASLFITTGLVSLWWRDRRSDLKFIPAYAAPSIGTPVPTPKTGAEAIVGQPEPFERNGTSHLKNAELGHQSSSHSQ